MSHAKSSVWCKAVRSRECHSHAFGPGVNGDSFEGAGIIKKDDWNGAYYGQGATPRGIVMEGKFKNPNTQALLKSLQPY